MWNKNERQGRLDQANSKVDRTSASPVNLSAPKGQQVYAMSFSLLALQWTDLSWEFSSRSLWRRYSAFPICSRKFGTEKPTSDL